jgi:DNA-binding transcriptional regulator YdaS (Cro superfamily)
MSHVYPLALCASQAAAMLGVSESQLRQWVIEGKVHKSLTVSAKMSCCSMS